MPKQGSICPARLACRWLKNSQILHRFLGKRRHEYWFVSSNCVATDQTTLGWPGFRRNNIVSTLKQKEEKKKKYLTKWLFPERGRVNHSFSLSICPFANCQFPFEMLGRFDVLTHWQIKCTLPVFGTFLSSVEQVPFYYQMVLQLSSFNFRIRFRWVFPDNLHLCHKLSSDRANTVHSAHCTV